MWITSSLSGSIRRGLGLEQTGKGLAIAVTRAKQGGKEWRGGKGGGCPENQGPSPGTGGDTFFSAVSVFGEKSPLF